MYNEEEGCEVSNLSSRSSLDSLNSLESNFTRGIINPNYPGFQHLAHTLSEHFTNHNCGSSDSDTSEGYDVDFNSDFDYKNISNNNYYNDDITPDNFDDEEDEIEDDGGGDEENEDEFMDDLIVRKVDKRDNNMNIECNGNINMNEESNINLLIEIEPKKYYEKKLHYINNVTILNDYNRDSNNFDIMNDNINEHIFSSHFTTDNISNYNLTKHQNELLNSTENFETSSSQNIIDRPNIPDILIQNNLEIVTSNINQPDILKNIKETNDNKLNDNHSFNMENKMEFDSENNDEMIDENISNDNNNNNGNNDEKDFVQNKFVLENKITEIIDDETSVDNKKKIIIESTETEDCKNKMSDQIVKPIYQKQSHDERQLPLSSWYNIPSSSSRHKINYNSSESEDELINFNDTRMSSSKSRMNSNNLHKKNKLKINLNKQNSMKMSEITSSSSKNKNINSDVNSNNNNNNNNNNLNNNDDCENENSKGNIKDEMNVKDNNMDNVCEFSDYNNENELNEKLINLNSNCSDIINKDNKLNTCVNNVTIDKNKNSGKTNRNNSLETIANRRTTSSSSLTSSQSIKKENKTNKKLKTKSDTFDMYSIEKTLPDIDIEAIENHLKAAKEEEQRRRTDREEIRRRLAMDCDDDYASTFDCYPLNEKRGRKPSLQSRLQNGMNLQICFMNDTISDNDSPSSDSETCPKLSGKSSVGNKNHIYKKKLSKPLTKLNMERNKNENDNPIMIINNESFKKELKKPQNLSLCSSLNNENNIIENDFYTKQAKLQIEARMALSQAKDMAHMQMEIERQKQVQSPITKVIRRSLEKVGVSLAPEKRRLSRQMLTQMNISQLQIIVNDLHIQIEMLNESLVKYLMERDDLHMSQDSTLVDIEDLTRFLGAKEQNQLREQNTNGSTSSPTIFNQANINLLTNQISQNQVSKFKTNNNNNKKPSSSSSTSSLCAVKDESDTDNNYSSSYNSNSQVIHTKFYKVVNMGKN